ncbi:unnamed protein product [Caenorhabditis nigoni]
MRSIFLIALLVATVAYCTEISTKVNTGGSDGLSTHTKMDTGDSGHTEAQTDVHSMQKRAEMETKMSTGQGAETNAQMDTGDQKMSAQAETHDRFRRWGGYYGGMGYGGYGGMGYGRGYGMGYGMRGYGGYGGYYG